MSDKIDREKIASELVDDKGYHSKQLMMDLREMNIRSCTSEPKRGRQKWNDDVEARDAVYANRRRIQGERGKSLLRRRGEFTERSFAHGYETGAMRHLYLTKRDNIAKRVLIHGVGFNLGVQMRVSYGLVKPRGLSDAAFALILILWNWLRSLAASMRRSWIDPTTHEYEVHIAHHPLPT